MYMYMYLYVKSIILSMWVSVSLYFSIFCQGGLYYAWIVSHIMGRKISIKINFVVYVLFYVLRLCAGGWSS